MESVELCKKRILSLILRYGARNYIPEEIIRRYFGSHWSDNHDKAIDELIYIDKILLVVIIEGVKRYGIDPDRLDEARLMFNKEVEVYPQSENVVQQYSGEPKGFTFWKEEFDTDRQRKRSRYTIYYKKTDHEHFKGRILSKSMFRPRTYDMGSLNNSKSKISRIWRAIQEAVRKSPNATFTLQNIQDIDRKAVNNNRQAGKIGLIILEELGWIKIVERRGGSKIYAITVDNSKLPPTLDDFTIQPLEEIFNDLDDLSHIDPEPDPDSWQESKEKDKNLRDSADGS